MAYRMIYFSGASEDDQATCEFIMRASEDGVTWGPEWVTLKESPTYNTLGPNITQLSNGDLLLVYNRLTRDPTVKLGVFWRKSTDAGLTWGDASVVPTSYSSEAEGGPIIELADGRWCCPFWADSGGKFDCACIFSSDVGETWGGEVVIADGSADGRSYVEPNIIEYEAGKLLALFRIPPDGSADQNQVWKSVSTDNGASWSAPAYVFDGRSAVRMCLLSNGKIVGYFREDGVEYPVIRTTSDWGVNWSASYKLLEDTPIHAHYGDCVEISGSRVGIVYSVGFEEGVDYAIFYSVIPFADLP